MTAVLVFFRNSDFFWKVGYFLVYGELSPKHVVKPDTIIAEEKFAVQVYSADGQAFRVTASDVAEPPLYQPKAWCEVGTSLSGSSWVLWRATSSSNVERAIRRTEGARAPLKCGVPLELESLYCTSCSDCTRRSDCTSCSAEV